MTQKTNQSGRIAAASGLFVYVVCLVWIAGAIATMLSPQITDTALVEFVHMSGSAFVIGGVLSVAFAVYLGFRHSWRAMAAAISLFGFLGATACFLRYAGI